MSDEIAEVDVQPEGTGDELQETVTEQATEAPKALTAEALEARLAQERQQYMEFARREAQSASDKRFAKVKEEVERLRADAESIGVKLTPEQLQNLQARKLLDTQDQAAIRAQDGLPNRPQPGVPPPHIIWGTEELRRAGVPFDAPEVEAIPPDDPDFYNKVLDVVDKYTQTSKQQTQPQASASPEARMPTSTAAGAASGNKFDQLLAEQRKLTAKAGKTTKDYERLNKVQTELQELAKRQR